MKPERLAEILNTLKEGYPIVMMYNITNEVRYVVYCRLDRTIYLTDDIEYVVDYLMWDLEEMDVGHGDFKIWR